MDFNSIISYAQRHNASDIYFIENQPPIVKIGTDINKLKVAVLTQEDIVNVLSNIFTVEQRQDLQNLPHFDTSYTVLGQEYRARVEQTVSGPCVSLKTVSKEVKNLQDLFIPSVIEKLLKIKDGLVIIAGTTGAGKTATLGAIVSYINNQDTKHIVSFHDPVLNPYPSSRSFIIQKDITKHATSLEEAVKSAMQVRPDIICIDIKEPLKGIKSILYAAQMNHAVFVTLDASSSVHVLSMIIDAFPPEDREGVRKVLASHVKGIIVQQPLNRQDQQGVIPAYEIMLNTNEVREAIVGNRLYDIPLIIGAQATQGMVSMSQSVRNLYQRGLITEDLAKEHLQDSHDDETPLSFFEFSGYIDSEF
ncbi:type IV pilus twitching motility protein PilT [Rickettsiales endosymbiont of Peranema trichophorum]|uniref:type IV pilus twitching motility protein PilT n=1 Tax=Rickettsiales endosymbiont of Peranema trichophorum TaxID=2486577 RepID=UPI0013EEC241|nr:ATPase, T2SS/T4P/T4SS family [Rickettsiales endosymbiont of Peranema trichophorum]